MIGYLRRRWSGGAPEPAVETPTVRVLVACMGNICRSPLAEGVLRHRLLERDPPLPVVVESAGTHGYHVGAPPDQRAQVAALRRGVDISAQRARQVAAADFAEFDVILAMDEENLAWLREQSAAEHQHKIALYLEYAGVGATRVVPDPYYGGALGFERVLDLVEEATVGIIVRLEPLAAARLAAAAEAAAAAESSESPDSTSGV